MEAGGGTARRAHGGRTCDAARQPRLREQSHGVPLLSQGYEPLAGGALAPSEFRLELPDARVGCFDPAAVRVACHARRVAPL
jgi:hypothetical protein